MLLRQQYNSVFSQPRAQWSVSDAKTFFQVEENLSSSLADFKFNNVDLELAFEELRGNSAPGPDGVPALLLKECKGGVKPPPCCILESLHGHGHYS